MKHIITTLTTILITWSAGAQLSWLKMADYPGQGRHSVCAFELGGKGYTGLGINASGSRVADWYEYNAASNTWTQKASLPSSGRALCAAFVAGGKGYVVGGETNSGGLSELWEYDGANNTWAQKAGFPGGVRSNGAGFVINGKIYFGTGFTGNSVTKDFYEYDPANNTWTQKADFPGAIRVGAGGFAVGDKGYLGMGAKLNSTGYYTDFYEYDATNNTWTQKADFPLPYIQSFTTYASNGGGYILGGLFYQGTGITQNPMNMLYKYTPQTNAWTLEGTFPGLPRAYAGGFTINNDIYFGPGSQSTNGAAAGQVNDLWKLTNGLTLMVQDSESNSDFKIFPNPSTNVIFLGTDMPALKDASVRIYDISGKQISFYSSIEAYGGINVEALAKGMYFVELITQQGEVLDSRFIKE